MSAPRDGAPVSPWAVEAYRTRWLWIASSIAGLALTLAATGVRPGALVDRDGLAAAAALAGGLIAPDLSTGFLLRVARLAGESVLMGVLGTAVGLALGGALALVAARPFHLPDAPRRSPWRITAREGARGATRAVLAFLRAVPEIVWAFLFVRIVGLGPGAAVAAIGLAYGGAIGKVFAELAEAADPGAARQLRAAGAGRAAVFLYGVFPRVARPWTAYALFRLECAIRSASILGVVGAGGLGMEIELSIRYFQVDKLATTLLAVLALVGLLEVGSALLRRAPARWTAGALAVGALAAVAALPVRWGDFVDSASLRQAAVFLAGFVDPIVSPAFLAGAGRLAALTVGMAALGTLVAALPALVLAPLAARTFAAGFLVDAPNGGVARVAAWGALGLARVVLLVGRALPELIWALLFVVWVGPGVTAGVLALAAHTLGILGRLYGDALEEADPEPARQLEAAGGGRTARLVLGVLPQSLPRMLAFTLYRFEVNVRNAAMVGFVGAGGLGDAIHTAVSLFHLRELATLLLVLVAVVVVLDAIGDRLRGRLLRAAGWG